MIGNLIMAFLLGAFAATAVIAICLIASAGPGRGVQPGGKVKPYPPRPVGRGALPPHPPPKSPTGACRPDGTGCAKSAIDRCYDGEMEGNCW